MSQYRTHTCGELRAADAGKTVTLAGWMENVREVGSNFAFVVLRDFYGTTQIVVDSAEMMKTVKGINKESTIAVTGTVRLRESPNTKLATGEIEVVPEKIEILGRCRYNELPFEINRSREADESARLKYRYLDLRNPAVKNNIILRCNVVAALRRAMMDHGFLEITTPILTASSPEGARDYLVPARKHPGKFYALPQAPQQFKQLLMTSGFDKYFQIAPCFRDEDARGDRSPGEFYQLDMEMAFASQEDVFAVLEDVLPPIFAEYGTYDIASQRAVPPHPVHGGAGEVRLRQARPAHRPHRDGYFRHGCTAAGFEPVRRSGRQGRAGLRLHAAPASRSTSSARTWKSRRAASPTGCAWTSTGALVGGVAKFFAGNEDALRASTRSHARYACAASPPARRPRRRKPPALCS